MYRTQSPNLLVSLLHDKVRATRQHLQWLEELTHDIEAIGESPAKDNGGEQKPNLRDVVAQVLTEAPDNKLSRRDIIRQVQARVPGVLPIGIISTLAAKALFRKVDGDSFQLRHRPKSEDKAKGESEQKD